MRIVIATCFLIIPGLIYTQSVGVTGLLGIGTNTPAEDLHVYDGNILVDKGANLDNTARSITLVGAMGTNAQDYAQLRFENFDFGDGNGGLRAMISSREH